MSTAKPGDRCPTCFAEMIPIFTSVKCRAACEKMKSTQSPYVGWVVWDARQERGYVNVYQTRDLAELKRARAVSFDPWAPPTKYEVREVIGQDVFEFTPDGWAGLYEGVTHAIAGSMRPGQCRVQAQA